MKMKMKMGLAAVGMAAALTVTAMTEAIAYRGVIRSAEGEGRIRVLPMTFTIYDSAAPDIPLWARYVPVKVAADGSFNVELKDSLGTNPLDLATPLATAVAGAKGDVEIGLKPPEAAEFKPRQRLATYLRAERAAVAKKVDEATVGGVLHANNVTADNMVVNGNLRFRGFAPRSSVRTIVFDRIGPNAMIRDAMGTLEMFGGVTGVLLERAPSEGYPPGATDSSRDRIVTARRNGVVTSEFFAAGEAGPTNRSVKVYYARVQRF